MALCNGKLHLSTDQGGTWSEANGGLPAPVYITAATSTGDTVVAYGGGTIWRTCDAGVSWAKWDEGYVGTSEMVYSISIVRGDSSIVLSVDGGNGVATWKRNPGSKWVRLSAPSGQWVKTKAFWFGKNFASSDATSGLELDPSDSVWKKSPATPAASTAAWFRGEWWAYSKENILKTSDSGRSWNTAYDMTRWVANLAVTSSALFGIGGGTMAMIDPASSDPVSYLKQPEQYGTDLVEIGKRWMFLGEDATWYSEDMGKQWTRGGIPGTGAIRRILPTSQGLLMEDYALREQAWISSDKGSWTPLALPPDVRYDGIDTAAGLLHAFGSANIWTRSGETWVRDSVVGDEFEDLALQIAWDGSRLWVADNNRLHSTALQPRIWTFTDSTPKVYGITAIRFWKDRLWVGGNVSTDYLSTTKPLGSRTKDGSWTYHDIRGSCVTAMAPTARALWIGTDSGLYRFDDDKTHSAVAIGPWKPGGNVVALAARGDTIAVAMAGSDWIAKTDKHDVYLSLDGGATWNRDEGHMALAFHIDKDRIVAASFEGGLVEWGDGTGTTRRAHGVERDFSWRPGRLEWNVSDARSLQILDAQGRILSHIDVAPGTNEIALRPASSLRIARLTGSSGSRTIAVPPLR